MRSCAGITSAMGRRWRSFAVVVAVLVPALSPHVTDARNSGLQDTVGDYLASRSGSVSVAVYDSVAGRQWVWRPHDRDYTASIVKVNILAALLHRQGQLSGPQQSLARKMITESDNDAASALYVEIGGAAGLDAFNKQAGLDQTMASSSWGLTTTSARDQVKILRLLATPNDLLSRSQRRYELGLMRSVVNAQCWGVAAGVPASADVALKNGWLPLSGARGGGWQLNSIGFVRGSGRRYFIAVLAHSPSYRYGLNTIEQISRLVWPYMRRAS